MNTLGQPFFNSLQIANVCALNAKNPQIIKEGFSGNQDGPSASEQEETRTVPSQIECRTRRIVSR
jgi:hypothetical protein